MHRFTYFLAGLCSLALILTFVACTGSSSSGNGDDDSGDPVEDATYTVSGELSGLTGDHLILRLNDDESLTIEDNGDFTFSSELSDGDSYTVSTQILPEAPAQNCDLDNTEGSIAGADVTDVTVSCHAAIELLGRVAGPVIPGANVEARVGDEDYEVSADEQGMYSLRLSVRDPDEMVNLRATDPDDGFILFQSYLGDMNRAQNIATSDGLLTREQSVAVNITNVSTANAALMRWRNEGTAPETEAERTALAEQYSTNLLLRSSALVQIAAEDPDRAAYPVAAATLAEWGIATAGASDTSSLIEDEEARKNYEEEVNNKDPDRIDKTVSEIVSDKDLVEGVDEDEVPNDWFGITGPEPNRITGSHFAFDEAGTGLYSNHVDAVTFQWEVVDGLLEIDLDESHTTVAFCWVENDTGDSYQTACVTDLEEFQASLVAREDGVDLVSVAQAGIRSYPDEPDRDPEEVDFREDLRGYHLQPAVAFDESDVVNTSWGMPGNFQALAGGLPWYSDELLHFSSDGVGQGSDSGAFNWSIDDSGWLIVEFGTGATHQIALKREQQSPAWWAKVLSTNDDGEARSYRAMIAPQLDSGGLDESFASEIFVQWDYLTDSDYAFAIDLSEAGWGGPRDIRKADDEVLERHYDFDYRFENGRLIMESWAQPRDDGDVWWGRESICDDTQEEDCYLTFVRSWTLLEDDGDWVSLLERIENLDEEGDLISDSPRVIQYRRF